jgi:GNAT superfamily N-acetyltransferase
MKYRAEALRPELERDISSLVDRYYDVTNANVRLPPYNFIWEVYRTLQESQRLLVVTARDEYLLAGFAMYLLMEHPHHRGMQVAECDTLAVDHTQRGKGIGKTLYLFAESMLIDMGIDRVVHHYRTVYDVEPLFPKLGFTLEEQVYVKELT